MLVVAVLNAFLALLQLRADTDDVRGLPLREIHATPMATPRATDVLVVFITGDGGWAALDKDVVAVLAEHGANIVGLDSRAYLGTRRTPDEIGRDVTRIVLHYARAWRPKRIVLAGYSRGADLMPFAANRLPTELKNRVTLIALLGLATRVGFEFHWQDIVRTVRRPGDLPTIPEVEKLRGMRMLCVHGVEEAASGCVAAPRGLMQTIALPGKHHFDNNYRELGELVWKALVTPES